MAGAAVAAEGAIEDAAEEVVVVGPTTARTDPK
jgi:hypothetical protein